MLKKLLSQQLHPLFFFAPVAIAMIYFIALAYLAVVDRNWTDISLCVVTGFLTISEFRKARKHYSDWKLYALLVESGKLHLKFHQRLLAMKSNSPR